MSLACVAAGLARVSGARGTWERCLVWLACAAWGELGTLAERARRAGVTRAAHLLALILSTTSTPPHTTLASLRPMPSTRAALRSS
jgi:hypothetical protein